MGPQIIQQNFCASTELQQCRASQDRCVSVLLSFLKLLPGCSALGKNKNGPPRFNVAGR